MVAEQNTFLYIVVPKHTNYTYGEVTAQCWQNKLSSPAAQKPSFNNIMLAMCGNEITVKLLQINFWPRKRFAAQATSRADLGNCHFVGGAGLTCERSISGAAKISIECLLRVSIDFFRRKIDRLA